MITKLKNRFNKVFEYVIRGGVLYWTLVIVERFVSLTNFTWRVYSAIAQQIFPTIFRIKMWEFDQPPHPLKIEWVDPNLIRSFTKREYPPWEYRELQFGSVQSGDWDQKKDVTVRSKFGGPPPDIYIADSFENSLLHQAMVSHFNHGIHWKDTKFIQIVLELVNERAPVWHECYTEVDIWERCNEIDQLYSDINENGYLTQLELINQGKRPSGYIHAFANEITVDVGQNGELLLVSGRHRLSIAKILGLQRVPVTFLVRHREWMKHRETVSEISDHPDLRDL